MNAYFFFLTFVFTITCWLYLARTKVYDYRRCYMLIVPPIFWVSIALCVIIISFRLIEVQDGVRIGGIDSIAYKKYFEQAIQNDYLQALFIQNYEIGYGSIVWILGGIVGDYKIYQIFIYSAIYLCFLFYAKQFKVNGHLFWSILLLSFMVVSSLNILRVTFTIFLGLWVLCFLYKNNYFAAILISLFAVSIHISATILVLMIAFFWIRNKIEGAKYLLVYIFSLVIFSVIVSLVFSGLLEGTKWGAYVENEGEFSLNTFLVAALIIFLTYNRLNDFIAYNSFNKVLIFTLPTIFFVFPVFYNYPVGYRLLLYYLPVMYFLLPSIFHVYRVSIRKNLRYFPLIVMLYGYICIECYQFFFIESEAIVYRWEGL